MDFRRLTDFLDGLIDWRIPGVDMMIDVDGKNVYRHQAGWRDREKKLPMMGDEVYNLYSVSKVVTCAAALTLYEQGKFLLSDPVGDYLPAYRNLFWRIDRYFDSNADSVMNADDSEDLVPLYTPMNGELTPPFSEDFHLPADSMTIRHLFTMTSGLNYDLETDEIREVVKRTNGRAPTLEVVNAIAKRSVEFVPGDRFLYSLSHDVLAAVVEAVSGMPFSEYVKKAIFEPCGMMDSTYHPTEAQLARMAQQYRFDDALGKAVPVGPANSYILGSEYDSGGAGMISTVEDYMRFARMMTRLGVADSGERILSPGTINLMRTNHLNERQMRSFDWPQFAGYGYGLGVRTMMDRIKSGSNGPVGEFGWGGAAGAYVLIDPENKVTAYYAQHMLNNQEPYIHPRLRNLIYACLGL